MSTENITHKHANEIAELVEYEYKNTILRISESKFNRLNESLNLLIKQQQINELNNEKDKLFSLLKEISSFPISVIIQVSQTENDYKILIKRKRKLAYLLKNEAFKFQFDTEVVRKYLQIISNEIEKFEIKTKPIDNECNSIKGKFYNLTLIEFLEYISNYNELKIYELSINDKDIIKGTIETLTELSKKTKLKELKNIIFKIKENDINNDFTGIEIYNYLKNITNNFELKQTEIVLKEFEVFETMELNELLIEKAEKVYLKNNWELPTCKLSEKAYLLNKKSINNDNKYTIDYDKMINKVFPFDNTYFYEAKNVLIKKISEYKNKRSNIEKSKYTYTTIFKDQSNAKKLKDFFELKQLTKNNIWQKNKPMNNLASFFFYLRDIEVIKQGEKKSMLKVFYDEFKAKGKYNNYSRVDYNKNYLLFNFKNELKTFFSKDK